MLAATNTDTLRDTISRSFNESHDGFWYPVEPGVPLARVQFTRDSYSIERRRNERSPWLPVVTAHAADFDPAAFTIWRERYPMVVAL